MAQKYAIEMRKPEFDNTWRRCPNTPVGTRKVVDDTIDFLRDRSMGAEYRVVEISAESPEADDIAEEAAACGRLKKSEWRQTIFVTPRGPGDYLERFCDAYPAVGEALSNVIRDAGTQDSDPKILVAAGAIIADLENWIARAAAAMHMRDGKKFDRLVAEAYHIMLRAAKL